MKQTYIVPQTQMTRIALFHMLAESQTLGEGTTDQGNGGWSKEDKDWSIWGD
ncbi:MAG: hypothetical protein IJ064_00605 [Bacteroidaceae bacterium]|nr:hypothetical protein [Bacteroidaceae bacterium]